MMPFLIGVRKYKARYLNKFFKKNMLKTKIHIIIKASTFPASSTVLEYEISDKESEKEDIESELDSLYDTAREELLETYKENTIDEINSQGVDYFIDNLGYSLEDAVTSFCTFDEDGFRESLVDNEDRGNTLSPYDGEKLKKSMMVNGTIFIE